jgi:phage baseplate assembly protein gpV
MSGSVMHVSMGPAETRVVTFLARAAKDLPDDSVLLDVIVPQLTPSASGPVTSDLRTAVVETQRDNGKVERASVATANTLTARWIGASNIKYAPTVRRGEQVQVYQFGDSDVYYWKALGRDPELRKLDVWRVEVSDKLSNNTPLTDDNTYFLEINTKASRVTLKTSRSNGEAARYAFVMDGKAGTFTLTDDQGNLAYMNSEAAQVRLANAKGSMLDLLGRSAFLVGPDDVVLKGGRQVVLDTPVFTTRTSKGGGVTRMEATAMTLACAGGFTVEAPTIGLNGQTTVDGTLVATDVVKAAGYSTGGGVAYPSSTTNIAEGTGSAAAPTPNSGDATGPMRHAAAYEQLLQLAAKIEELVPETAGQLVPIAETSQMVKNTGE